MGFLIRHKVIIGLVLCGLIIFGYVNYKNYFPSSEMRHLRAVEAKLNLPQYISRSEDDSGRKKHLKSSGYYTVHNIYLTYSNEEVFNEVLSIFTVSGDWLLEKDYVTEGISTSPMYDFYNAELQACANVITSVHNYIRQSSSGNEEVSEITYSLSLHHKNTTACGHDFY